MSDNQKGLEAEILIEKLVHRGAGLGRIDGQVCLVPFTVPGDLVKVQVTKRRSGMVEAEVAEIIGLGPGRTHPKCEVLGGVEVVNGSTSRMTDNLNLRLRSCLILSGA